jgi:hypothetical protein
MYMLGIQLLKVQKESGTMTEPLKKMFEMKITVGNLITIALIIVGGLIGYTRLEDQVNTIIDDYHEHKTIQIMEQQNFVRKDVQETRNRFIDQKLDMIQDRLDAIYDAVRVPELKKAAK